MPLNTQLGVKDESTYGSAVTPDIFFEYESESIAPEAERYESASLRTTTRALRDDRFFPYVKGYTGSVSLPVLTKSFGFWLDKLTGGTVSTAGPTDSTYTHTFNVGSLCDLGFTLQVNRPIGACGDTNQAFTYAGGKVTQWTLSQEQGGVLMLEADMVFQSGTTATALASASYASGMEFVPWSSSSLTINALSVPVKNWSVQCNNNLDVDRMFIDGSSARAQPYENGMREITFSCTADFNAIVDNTPSGAAGLYNRVVSSTVAGSLAPVVITCNGPTVLGASAYPGLTITMSAVRFDEASNNVSGAEIIESSISGKALTPSSGQLCQLAYRTADATP